LAIESDPTQEIGLSRPSKSAALPAFLSGRAIKFFANSLRPAFYLHFWLFPKQRFSLSSPLQMEPREDASFIDAKAPGNKIPKILWQTNYTNQVTLPVKATWLCNRLLSKDFEYLFHTTEMREAFVESHFPGEVSSLYKRLTIGASQADLWRLLALYKYGGVYLDIDAHLVWPLNRIISGEKPEVFLRYKNGSATNYFIASFPGNPTIKALIDEVLYRIEHNQSNNVHEISGPTVFEDVLRNRAHDWRFSQHTCLQGNFSNKFFQYIDKSEGHWTLAQTQKQLVKPKIN
jgi:mannosyltransferase OCH1-like enzyme